MKKCLVLCSFIFIINDYLHAEYVDLGIRGKQYEIKEKSFKDEIAIRLKDVDYAYWEKEMISQIDKSLIIESDLSSCKKNNQWVYDPTKIIESDIVIPYFNKVAYKKGYKYNPLKENNIQFKKYMFFVDADDMSQLILAKKYSSVAEIFVVKGDIKKLKDYGLEGMLFRPDIEGKAFKVNCLPTIYTQDTNVFKVNEYKLGE